MKAQTVTIIGTGRVGSSVGLALQESALPLTVIGHDRRRDIADDSLAAGAVDRVERNLVNAVSQADIVVFAGPMAELKTTLMAIGEDLQPHALFLDFSSLKSPAFEWAQTYLRSGYYVGAMPVLAARYLPDGRRDVDAASADLFRDSLFCLMPSPETDPQAVGTAVNFGSLLGARPYFLDPAEYDSLVQGVATLPGLLAAALFNAVAGAEGWRDMLRLANVSFGGATQPLAQESDIVHQILYDKTATLRWLDAVLAELVRWRALVEEGDAEVLELAIGEAAARREAWLAERARNEWVDAGDATVRPPNLSEQMFGTWLANVGDRDKGK